MTIGELTGDELRVLKHTLGLDRSPKLSYRNYYASDDTCDGHNTILSLIAKGLMREGHRLPGDGGGMPTFHATEAGKRLFDVIFG